MAVLGQHHDPLPAMAEFALDQRAWHSHTARQPGDLAWLLFVVDFGAVDFPIYRNGYDGNTARVYITGSAGSFAFLQRTPVAPAGSGAPWLYIRGAGAHIVVIASSFAFRPIIGCNQGEPA